MWTTIRDVMADYEDGASAAGVSNEEMLTEDQVRGILVGMGRYEDLDQEMAMRALFEATDTENTGLVRHLYQ